MLENLHFHEVGYLRASGSCNINPPVMFPYGQVEQAEYEIRVHRNFLSPAEPAQFLLEHFLKPGVGSGRNLEVVTTA